MKTLTEFALTTLTLMVASMMLWVVYNHVTYLFPSLPQAWKYLDWWTVYCLTILIRTVSTVMRMPDIKVKD